MHPIGDLSLLEGHLANDKEEINRYERVPYLFHDMESLNFRFTKTTVHFFLSFLYGGLTTITEEVDVWEVIELSRKINMDSLAQVAALHLKTNKCHFFHRVSLVRIGS